MNLEELRSIQDTERKTDSLQALRPSFYEEIDTYMGELRAERERVAAERGFDDPTFRRLSDEIEAAEDTIESIYERRVGKVVQAASFAAAGMPADEAGLTEEEQTLFDQLVADIERNRERVLEDIVPAEDAAGTAATGPAEGPAESGGDGDTTASAAPPSDDDRASEAEGVDAADAMGDPDHAGRDEPTPDEPGEPDRRDTAAAEPVADDPNADAGTADDPEDGPNQAGDADATDADPGTEPDGGADEMAVDRTTVRITRDVGEIFGVDRRTYDLGCDDVVTLPAANADPLLEQGAAERLE